MEERDNLEELRELEEQEDQLEDVVRRFQREEEQEDNMLLGELDKLDRIYDTCDAEDIKLKSLLEEKREILCKMRNEKNSFADEFYARVRDEKRKLDEKREELRYQMSETHEEDEINK